MIKSGNNKKLFRRFIKDLWSVIKDNRIENKFVIAKKLHPYEVAESEELEITKDPTWGDITTKDIIFEKNK